MQKWVLPCILQLKKSKLYIYCMERHKNKGWLAVLTIALFSNAAALVGMMMDDRMIE